MREKCLKFITLDTPLGLVFQNREFVKHRSPILFEQYFENEKENSPEKRSASQKNEELKRPNQVVPDTLYSGEW
jgi:hypothetical protein